MGLECVAQKRERARPARPPPMVVAPRPLPPPSHERLRAEAHPYYRQQQQHALQASPFQQALGPGFAPGPPGLYSVPFVLRDGTVFTEVTEHCLRAIGNGSRHGLPIAAHVTDPPVCFLRLIGTGRESFAVPPTHAAYPPPAPHHAGDPLLDSALARLVRAQHYAAQQEAAMRYEPPTTQRVRW